MILPRYLNVSLKRCKKRREIGGEEPEIKVSSNRRWAENRHMDTSSPSAGQIMLTSVQMLCSLLCAKHFVTLHRRCDATVGIAFCLNALHSCSAPLHFSLSVWIPVWLEQPLSQHCPLSCLSPSLNTRLRWLFCFWIPVNIFILHWWGVLRPDVWWGVINNICPFYFFLLFFFYLFTLRKAVGEGEGGGGGGWVSFLKFTWTCVQTTLRGRATVKERESVPPKADLVYRYCRLTVETRWQIKDVPTLKNTLILWHICHTHMFLCYFTGSTSIQ